MATSAWPWRQARPKESAITTAGWPRQRGAQRARRGVGVAREQDDRVGRAGVRGVDARVRAHEAVVGAADEHAARGRASTSVDSSSTTWTRRGSLPCSAASARARSPADAGQRDDAAFGLRDDLVGHDEDVAAGRRSPPAAARAARRGRRPGAPRAAPGSAPDEQLAHRPRAPREQQPRVCARAAGLAARARRAARRGRRRCRRRAASDGRLRDAHVAPAARAACSWRARLPGPKLGVDRVGRREHERVGAGAVAVGTTTHRAAGAIDAAPARAARRSRPGPAPGSRRARAATRVAPCSTRRGDAAAAPRRRGRRRRGRSTSRGARRPRPAPRPQARR